ncbi:MAG TPA: neutral/alkaline non-lysosomal ceramidase N-terminal domain-containing protein, partial [Gemmataceae bacterium]|nr:neutral/alkaline non-lysosomal ceramidase N-terminal domain-containing protein [Gemmataceae bacterium]
MHRCNTIFRFALATACGFALAGFLQGIQISSSVAPLRAGFGESDITPKLGGRPVYLAGFDKNRKATGVHDPIMARAIVLADGKRKLALVSVDVVGLFQATVENVRKKLSGFDYVLVSSTHNHEGPDTLGLWGPGPLRSGVDPAYMKQLEEAIARAVTDADRAVRPVIVRLGTARAPELLHDGREPIVKHDELVAIEFRDPKSNKTTGLVVQWNCHPETLDSRNKLISADFVWATVAYLKKRHDCPVVYFTGTVGGLMTSLHVEVKDDKGNKLADGTFEKTERYGKLVGQLADKALSKAETASLTPLE